MGQKNWVNLLKIFGAAVFSLVVQSAWAFDGALTYERFARLNTPSQKLQATDWLGLELDTDRVRQTFDYHLHTDVRYYSEDNDYNYSVEEAYIQFTGENHHLGLGRKLMDWSPHQTYWQLDYLNPQKGFNLLSQKQEGLMGVHYDYRPNKEGIRFSAFFSYLYIPSLNPSIDIENGQVSSTSEWQVLPPSKTVVRGQKVPIFYKLNMPPIEDIILQKSLGMKLAYSWESGKILSYAIYKPESGVRANAEAFFNLDKKQVQVAANPIVNHHLMFGSSLHQRFQGVDYSAGIDVVDPNARLGGEDFEALGPLQLERSNRTFESEFFTVMPSYDRESYAYLSASFHRYWYDFSLNYTQL